MRWNASNMLVGLGLALRHWPWPEFLLVYLLNEALALSFARALGWHRYWSGALLCLLLAAALCRLAEGTGRALCSRLTRVCPDPAPAP